MDRWHPLPAELYALVAHTPATVLLETARARAAEPRFDPDSQQGISSSSLSRLFTAPLRILTANECGELPTLFSEVESAVAGGQFAAGFFTYECGACFEPTAVGHSTPPGLPAAATLSQPLAWFGVYDRCFCFDHRTGVFLDGDPPGLAQFRTGAEEPAHDSPAECTLAITEQEYAGRIAAIHEWIRAGDVYQLNFTVPIRVRSAGSVDAGSIAALYRRLRSRQPAPYGAFLHSQPNRRILSFSPELFFRLEGQRGEGQAAERRITTRPMKGTAPRGRTTREDRELAEWLSNDAKNRSENVMIVDLLRNDLGRLCNYGSVRAENLFAVERYPTLLQMTSTVTGELRPDVGFQQIFRALFPCGSVTGAPKIRAMQLLAELEQQPRGVYTGAIGFFSRERSIFNVAIRTLELEGNCGTMGVGSGIVIDSDPESEFRECLLKAEFLTRSSDRFADLSASDFSLIETLLWDGGFPLIELHLDRLDDSACYFGFPCNRASAKEALLVHAASFAQTPGAPSIPRLLAEWVGSQQIQRSAFPRKVRLLLNRDGDLSIESEILPEAAIAGNAPQGRVRIASKRTDPQDPMFFHKTTHRPLYAEAFKAATQAGFDDVVFINLRGEVTEGAINNIFIEKDGCLLTPPVECGLLAGVQRRHLLETRPSAMERVLTVEDLRQADAVYLSNAVRGLRRVVIGWES